MLLGLESCVLTLRRSAHRRRCQAVGQGQLRDLPAMRDEPTPNYFDASLAASYDDAVSERFQPDAGSGSPFLAEQANGGRMLELGIQDGRIVLPAD